MLNEVIKEAIHELNKMIEALRSLQKTRVQISSGKTEVILLLD